MQLYQNTGLSFEATLKLLPMADRKLVCRQKHTRRNLKFAKGKTLNARSRNRTRAQPCCRVKQAATTHGYIQLE
jgi:hypothetical protein